MKFADIFFAVIQVVGSKEKHIIDFIEFIRKRPPPQKKIYRQFIQFTIISVIIVVRMESTISYESLFRFYSVAIVFSPIISLTPPQTNTLWCWKTDFCLKIKVLYSFFLIFFYKNAFVTESTLKCVQHNTPVDSSGF